VEIITIEIINILDGSWIIDLLETIYSALNALSDII